MTNPAYIVEGQMEQRFIQNICPGSPVRLLNCNGDSVAFSAIAARVSVISRFLKNNYPIVVILDRERRSETHCEMRNSIAIELGKLGHTESEFYFGIPDRTIENWILADPECIRRELGLAVPCGPFEGSFGKSKLRQALLPDVQYGETTTGVRLLKAVQLSVAIANSASLNDFMSNLPVTCWWTQQP